LRALSPSGSYTRASAPIIATSKKYVSFSNSDVSSAGGSAHAPEMYGHSA
jgi:hypothetical protein